MTTSVFWNIIPLYDCLRWGVVCTSVWLDSLYLSQPIMQKQIYTVYKYLEKSWFLYEVKASVMFIGEKRQPWRKKYWYNYQYGHEMAYLFNFCYLSVTLGCFVTCNKILNNKYNKTLLIQDRFVFVTFIWQKCISKGYGENGRHCNMPY